MNIQPLEDRVLIQRVESEEKTEGGIIVPETAQEKPQEGIVRAAGPGTRNDAGERVPMEVSEGDKVLFGKYSGTEITVEGEEHMILRESELIAVIEDCRIVPFVASGSPP
jgi:chaperonin GroES